MFKALKVDHIGIAVKDLDQAKKFYTEVLGLQAMGEEVVEEQKVRVCFIPCVDSEVELLESTSPDGPIAKFIEKKGEGIQHMAFAVKGLQANLTELEGKGVQLIDKSPRKGAEGLDIAFLHPKSTQGILTELCENKNK